MTRRARKRMSVDVDGIQHELDRYSRRKYQLQLPLLGSGDFGSVFKAKTSTGEVAVKYVRPEAFTWEEMGLGSIRLLREIRILAHFNHSNIVRLRDLVVPPDEDFTRMFMVLDLMPADLDMVMQSQELDTEQIEYLVYQTLCGLRVIHAAGVVHRDLKPANLLIDPDTCALKICDFGLSREISSDMTVAVATVSYRAPEITLGAKYGPPVDIWSVGCILAEMLGLGTLFPGPMGPAHMDQIAGVLGSPGEEVIESLVGLNESTRRYLEHLREQNIPPSNKLCGDNDEKGLHHLLTRMLRWQAADRTSIIEALEHPCIVSWSSPQDFDEPGVTLFEFDDTEYPDVAAVKRAIQNEVQAFRRPRPPSRPSVPRSPLAPLSDVDCLSPRTAYSGSFPHD